MWYDVCSIIRVVCCDRQTTEEGAMAQPMKKVNVVKSLAGQKAAGGPVCCVSQTVKPAFGAGRVVQPAARKAGAKPALKK